MKIQTYHADKMFHCGKTWEVQPVTMDDGEKRVHLWPMADRFPDGCELTPDDAETLGVALLESVGFIRAGGLSEA